MGDTKKDRTGNKFDLKLPALDGRSQIGLTLKCEIPSLTRAALPKRSPNYLPRLFTLSFDAGKKFVRSSNNSSMPLEQGKLRSIYFLPPINQSGISNEIQFGLRKHQPSWFKVFSMRYEQKNRGMGKEARNKAEKKTSARRNCNAKKNRKGHMKRRHACKTVTKVKDDEDGRTLATKSKESLEDIQMVKKTSSEFKIDNKVSQKQMSVPSKVSMVTSDEKIVKNPIRERCWIPNEQRRRLVGPKEFGVNEEQFLKCASKYIPRKGCDVTE